MDDRTGWIVASTAGHDRQRLYFIVGARNDNLLLANGKQRRQEAPKRKKRGHVAMLHPAEEGGTAAQKLCAGQPVTDRELRRALAAFKGGNHPWQKRI